MTESYVVPLASDGKPVVFVKGNAVYTDSRTLAADTGKQHGHILRDIDHLAKEMPLQDWRALFSAVSEFSPTANRDVRYFEMTRDGFMLLAMGFTGKEWTEWKLKLIGAFNYMEAQLRENVDDVLNNPSRLRTALANYAERVETLEVHLATTAPKAIIYDQIASSDLKVTITVAAKVIKKPPNEVFEWMRAHKWIYKNGSNTPNQDKINAGLMILEIGPIKDGPSKGRMVAQPYLTGRGVLKLAEQIWAGSPDLLKRLKEVETGLASIAEANRKAVKLS